MNKYKIKSLRPGIIAALLLMSLTAFGQTAIKPVKREVIGRDTFTVFTLKAEREIVYLLRLAQITNESDSLLRQQLSGCEEAGLFKDSIGAALNAENNNLNTVAAFKDVIIGNLKKDVADERKKARRYKREKNIALGGGFIGIIAAIIFL